MAHERRIVRRGSPSWLAESGHSWPPTLYGNCGIVPHDKRRILRRKGALRGAKMAAILGRQNIGFWGNFSLLVKC